MQMRKGFTMKDLNLMVAGPQGSGINFTSDTFSKVMARLGYYVFSNAELFSTIKGEHSYFRVRVSDELIRSYSKRVDILIALDSKSIILHKDEVDNNGFIITEEKPLDSRFIQVEYNKILQNVANKYNKNLSELSVMKNTIALAVVGKIASIPKDAIQKVISENFAKRPNIAELNNAVVDETYSITKIERSITLPKGKSFGKMLINAAEAVAIGKIAAGLRFQSYYPITPASDESQYLEGVMSKYNVIVEQTEDEIAAINMAIAAANTGLRAATSTSGPGFSLMVEALSYAGMTETPVVIFYYQRAGPSTGMPTRHEQGDLKFAISAGHGEFPRIVIAPGDHEEAFYDAFESFNLAEKYQLPVIVMLDKSMAMSNYTIPKFDTSKLKIDRGKLILEGEVSNYKRYAFTEDGISPRTVPGVKNGMFTIAGDEHEEDGHIFSEDPDNRIRMMDKRMGKLKKALSEIPTDMKYKFYGNGENLIISWGSPKGAILDAIRERPEYSYLQIRLLHPFPVDEVKPFAKYKRIVTVEQNYSGQLADILKEDAGIEVNSRIVKFNGRPIAFEELIEGLDRSKTERRVVLTYA